MDTLRGLLSLPLEVICLIFGHLSPHHCFYFSCVSRYTSQIFKLNISKILDQTISDWGCLLYRCPECRVVQRSRDTSIAILYNYTMAGEITEELLRICRKCRRSVKNRNAIFMRSLFDEYTDGTITTPEIVDLARKGICRYECTYPPGNKDIKYMKDVMEKITTKAIRIQS